MARLKPVLWLALGIGVLGTAGLLLRPKPAPDANAIYRSYTATAQVMKVKALSGGSCSVQVKMHTWSSLSEGFTLAQIPRKGQLYDLNATSANCTALEVALASQGDPNDLKSPRHIYYKAGQARSGQWIMLEAPKAPVGCGGL
ncbi:MAG: hypothetical protein C4332_09335 [Meiothermus sp.]